MRQNGQRCVRQRCFASVDEFLLGVCSQKRPVQISVGTNNEQIKKHATHALLAAHWVRASA